MNWERAKTVLIIFFLIVNICFLVILIHMHYTDATLSEDTVKTTVALLDKNDIIIKNTDIIPKQKSKNQNYNLTTLMLNDKKMLAKWLGEGYKTIKQDLQEHNFIYQNKNKLLTLNKTEINFVNDKKIVLLADAPAKEIENFLSSKLKEFNFDKKEYYFKRVWFENGLYHAIISPLADETKILGIDLSISSDKEALTSVKGNYFTKKNIEKFDVNGLVDITTVLAKMIYLPKDSNMEITEISYAGYVYDAYLENKEITAIPVYVISCADGQKFFYDARTGEMLG